MMKLGASRHYIFLIISSIFFLIIENSMYDLGFLYTYSLLIGIVSSVLFISYTSLYFLGAKDKKDRKWILDVIFLCL